MSLYELSKDYEQLFAVFERKNSIEGELKKVQYG